MPSAIAMTLICTINDLPGTLSATSSVAIPWAPDRNHKRQGHRSKALWLLEQPVTTVRVQVPQRHPLLPRWGRVPVSAVTTADIEAWLSDLTGSGLSPSRTRQAYTVLRGVLDTALKSRMLAVNPALGVDLPAMPKSRRRYLTMGQLESLADAAGDYALLVRVLGYCGLRWGEAAALTVGKCDLLRSRLHIDSTLVDIAGGLTLGTPKSDKVRDVPLSRFLRDELAVHLADRAGDELVFTSPLGGYLRNPNFRRGYFDRAAREVGLDGLVPHELRHTAASLAIQSGANIKVVQTMLGHSSATLTWDRYGHLYDDDLDSVADRLDAASGVFANELRTICGLRRHRRQAGMRLHRADQQFYRYGPRSSGDRASVS